MEEAAEVQSNNSEREGELDRKGGGGLMMLWKATASTLSHMQL